tara:strand:+ start:17433 stop:18404 length:972 start_codon:yes stop_codon:yes gene_type:complete
MFARALTKRVTAGAVAVLGVVMVLATLPAQAQTYFRGQHIEPAYEGWEQNPDGSYNFIFGYHNENWEEELDIQIGENNFFSPGEADRGQPTHFLPRRNRFTFKVQVPADWGDKELAWTITANGETRTAYATLAKDYVIDSVVIASETGSLGAGTSTPESRANTPPVVSVIGDTVRNVRVGEPLLLRTEVKDDGLPKQGIAGASFYDLSTRTATSEIRRFMRAPSRITVGKVNGLYLSWNVYRGDEESGDGNVEFYPPQVKPWEDTRASANSPWGAYWTPPPYPEDGIYETSVTFDKPGQYILWARADDGGLYHDQYITVNVNP